MPERPQNPTLARVLQWCGSPTALAREARVHLRTAERWIAAGNVPAGPARLLAMLLAPHVRESPKTLEERLRR